MDSYELYQDIKSRTNGEIYIGVVGPVRSGKSTFIKRVMDKLVLPNIADEERKKRVIDELPQSGDGKLVMTTQPKFVPDGGIKVALNDVVDISVRMVDCVGYLIDGVEGNDRNVRTPWSAEEMTFEAASEYGTRKVMAEHSTIGVVVTTDGTVADFERHQYIATEERVITEMKAIGKPFVIVLNSKAPEKAKPLSEDIKAKYGVPCIPMDVMNMSGEDINAILESALNEFPLVSVNVDMPKWLQLLPAEHPIIAHILGKLTETVESMTKISDYRCFNELFADDEYLKPLERLKPDFGSGVINITLEPHEHMFYGIMSEMCGVDISDESSLFEYIRNASVAEKEYGKLKSALEDVDTRGYGIVLPADGEVELETPDLQQCTKTIRMTAKSTCLHIMKVDVSTEVSPIAGGGGSEEMVNYLKHEYEGREAEIWNTNLFGKPLSAIALEGLNQKMYAMPQEAQNKLRRAVTRIVNESRGGVLCILL